MMRKAVRTGECPPHFAPKLVVYTLATAFSISPLEVYRMPVSLVKEMLFIHQTVKELEAEEIEKAQKKMKV
tara:strand:- start:292 stop:504 length:213 start_codon:yes stop_codon:yes gene_type:complete